MKYIYIIAAFNAFFFIVLTFQKKPKALHDKILIFWLFYLGLYIGIFALYSKVLFTKFPIVSASFISFLMLHGPFLYLYISSLVTTTHKLKSKNLLHFMPFILFNLYLLIVSFSPEVSERIHLDHVENDHDSPLIFLIFLILTALSGPVYFGASIKLFKTLDINIFNNFSYSENINLDWLRKLVYIFGFVWTLLVIITSLHHVFHVFSWIFCTNGIFLALSIFVILIGYFGLKQKEIFAYQGKDSYVIKQKTEKYSGSGLKDSDARHYLEILTNYMAVEKPYLDPNLNLPQLAKDINIPIHYLSQIINEKLHNNFFNYINQFRVEEVKSKIFDPKFENYSLLGIAMDSGFNSKSVFNRIFKKYTNQTPSQFKASLSKR